MGWMPRTMTDNIRLRSELDRKGKRTTAEVVRVQSVVPDFTWSEESYIHMLSEGSPAHEHTTVQCTSGSSLYEDSTVTR